MGFFSPSPPKKKLGKKGKIQLFQFLSRPGNAESKGIILEKELGMLRAGIAGGKSGNSMDLGWIPNPP